MSLGLIIIISTCKLEIAEIFISLEMGNEWKPGEIEKTLVN
jgi:hypothetical protein